MHSVFSVLGVGEGDDGQKSPKAGRLVDNAR